jgi:hypothetical protein
VIALAEHRGMSEKRKREREHELDRMVVAAVYRRERAREGKGFRFQLPPSLREKP